MQKILPIEETSFILSRASSGIMNGAFYGKMGWLGVTGLVLTVGFAFFSLRGKSKWWKWCLLISSICTVLVFLKFLFPILIFDIHLFTLAAQSFQALGMFLNKPKGWWRQLLTVSPAVFLQKLFVNVLGGNKWNYQGTDVANGAYYSIGRFKIPRAFKGNMVLRLTLSVLSLTILIIKYKKPHNL